MRHCLHFGPVRQCIDPRSQLLVRRNPVQGRTAESEDVQQYFGTLYASIITLFRHGFEQSRHIPPPSTAGSFPFLLHEVDLQWHHLGKSRQLPRAHQHLLGPSVSLLCGILQLCATQCSSGMFEA